LFHLHESQLIPTMEKRANDAIQPYWSKMKQELCDKCKQIGGSGDGSGGGLTLAQQDELMECITSYPIFVFEKQHFVSKPVPAEERCLAIRSNGAQCERAKKRGEQQFCSTHCKMTPQGIAPGPVPIVREGEETTNPRIRREVFIQDVRGIAYYVDKEGNVYKTEDILDERPQPRIIAHYLRDAQGVVTIPELGLF